MGSKMLKIRKQLFRKSKILKTIRQYIDIFMNQSSVHGLNHITSPNRHFTEILFWSTAVALSLYVSVWLCLSTWKRYQENPTVISMERNYKEWNITLPSITVCPDDKVDMEKLYKFVNKFSKPNETLEFILKLADATYNTFKEIPLFDLIKSENYLKIILNLNKNFKHIVSSSSDDILDLFTTQLITEFGICYSYNSKTAIYKNPKYWLSNNWTFISNIPVFEGNPLNGDIYAQIGDMIFGHKAFIYSPTEAMDVTNTILRTPKNRYKSIDVTGINTYTTKEAELLSIKQRKCRLPQETTLEISPYYTYKDCRIQCRLSLANKLCGCIPFFYRTRKKYKICDVAGMHCLANFKGIDYFIEKLIKLRVGDKKEECNCFPPCQDYNYFIISESTVIWNLGTNIKCSLIKYPRIRFKRDILFGFTDLLVQLGGTAGLCLGCSVLSLAEIIYFTTFRLIRFLTTKEYM